MRTTQELAAREIAVARRTAAEDASLSSIARLLNRQARLDRRIERLRSRVHTASTR